MSLTTEIEKTKRGLRDIGHTETNILLRKYSRDPTSKFGKSLLVKPLLQLILSSS
jgi:hypothetical protein